MDIKVRGDEKQQILAGIDPWSTATVAIDLATLSPEQRQLVAEGYVPTITEAKSEAVTAALAVEVERRAAEQTKIQARQIEADEQGRRAIEAAHVVVDSTHTDYYAGGVELHWLLYDAKIEYVRYMSDRLIATWTDRRDSLRAEASQRTKTEKAAALLALQPAIEAGKAAQIEAEAQAKRAKVEALRVKLARRKEVGAVEVEITRGDAREWGTPWGAVVSAQRGKDVYNFDASDYDLSTEIVTIHCQPGDIIAWGQKNYRKANRTTHERRRVAQDWRLESV